MGVITTATLIAATICSTVGLIFLVIWIKDRRQFDKLLFAVSSFSVAIFAVFETAAMLAETPDSYGAIVKWAHVPGLVMIVGSAWFVYLYTGVGRKWLLWLVTIGRTIVVIIDLLVTPNINYVEISGIHKVWVLGEYLSIAVGTASPWLNLIQISLLLPLIFCIEVGFILWRKGDRRHSLSIGGTTAVFYLATIFVAALTFRGMIKLPFIVSWFYTAIIIAMAIELSTDVVRAEILARELALKESDLKETEQRLSLSASTARVGVWSRDLDSGIVKASDEWLSLFGFEPGQTIKSEDVMERVHPEDKERLRQTLQTAIENTEEYETEYRILLPTGELRWIGSRGKVEPVGDGQKLHSGASVDISKLKIAESAVHDLSGKLIDAQEAERSRLARELHDDLSQSLALLSIQLEVLQKEVLDSEVAKERIDDLIEDINRLSSDVRAISHELHPAKLSQLGLESALRGFCREISTAHRFKVDFDAVGVPRNLSNDISLCLYRIAQESLQNAGKHSGASLAAVKLTADDGFVKLTITDNGSGFDPNGAQAKGSLGLISMRERIHSVKGRITITSAVGTGTKIEAIVPLQQ
jgi:PAS domain S-box-containing protein